MGENNGCHACGTGVCTAADLWVNIDAIQTCQFIELLSNN